MNLLIVFALETCKSKKSKTQREAANLHIYEAGNRQYLIFLCEKWLIDYQNSLDLCFFRQIHWDGDIAKSFYCLILHEISSWAAVFDRQEFGSYSVSDKCSQLVYALTHKSLPVDVQTSLLLMYQHLSLMTDRWSGSVSQTGELLSFKPPSSLHIILIIIIRQVEPPLPNPLHQGH